MTRRRLLLVLAAALAVISVAGFAVLPGEASEATIDTVPAAADEPTSTTTTEPAPPTTTTTLPVLPSGGLSSGASGPAVLALEELLVKRHFDPGTVDGKFDGATAYAVMGFEKVAGMDPSGRVDALVWSALTTAPDPEPLLPGGGLRRVEIDKVRQLLFLYEEGALTLVSHVSTGSEVPYCAKGECGSAVTPAGSHRFMWRVEGWRQSRLGRLYNPVYFTAGGIAVHGFGSVPTHPASHGCVRIPMHTASWFPSKVEQGDPVYVFDGAAEVVPLGPADAADLGTPVDDGGPGTESDGEPGPDDPPQVWLDGRPMAPTPTTQPATLLA